MGNGGLNLRFLRQFSLLKISKSGKFFSNFAYKNPLKILETPSKISTFSQISTFLIISTPFLATRAFNEWTQYLTCFSSDYELDTHKNSVLDSL